MFPRTQLSYHVQRKSLASLGIANEDLKMEGYKWTSQQAFKNFIKDHQAWQYKRDKKIADKVQQKENKIVEQLTFRPKINDHSLEILPKRTQKIENRLMKEGQKIDEKLRSIYESHTFAFQPNIYNKNHNRCQSAIGKPSESILTKKSPNMPPKPPKTSNKDLKKHRIDFQSNYQIIRNDMVRDKQSIREYSPILNSRNLSYYTLSPEKL